MKDVTLWNVWAMSSIASLKNVHNSVKCSLSPLVASKWHNIQWSTHVTKDVSSQNHTVNCPKSRTSTTKKLPEVTLKVTMSEHFMVLEVASLLPLKMAKKLLKLMATSSLEPIPLLSTNLR